MKSIEQKISEALQVLRSHNKPTEKYTGSLEQKINLLEADITEFGYEREYRDSAPRRIMRKNGSFIESDVTADDKILEHMKQTGSCFREASIVMTGVDPGKNAKFPTTLVESLKKAWREYCPSLTDAEVTTLAERGVRP
jgi:hypothetical protein